MKRVAFGVLWAFVLTFVFWILIAVGFGVVAAFTFQGQGDPAKDRVAVEAAFRPWVWHSFCGSLAAAIGLSAWGVLPGTRRRSAAAADPGVIADSDDPASSGYPVDYNYPRARPIIAVPLGTPEAPPEIAALGPPLSVHGPGRLGSLTVLQRFMILVLGVALLVGPVMITNALDLDLNHYLSNSAKIALVFGMLGSFLTCLVIAVTQRSPYAYQLHRDALVYSDGKTMRIIPWDQVQALLPAVTLLRDFTVVTRDGQEVPIKGGVRDYHGLAYKVFFHVSNRLLPLMIEKANAGRMVEFGPLGVSIDALRYKGRTVPWEEVTQLMIVTGSGLRHLKVHRRGVLGFWPFCQLKLDSVPNDLLLLELLKRIAPSRLLVQAEPRW